MEKTLTVWDSSLKGKKTQYPAYCVTSVIIYSYLLDQKNMDESLLCMLKPAKVGSGRD